MIDFFAGERHFLDHLLPVYRALPDEQRGTFYVASDLGEHAQRRGLTAVALARNEYLPTYTSRDTDRAGTQPNAVVIASYGDHKKVRRMGYSRIAAMEHGIGQSYGGDRHASISGSYAGGLDRHDAGLALMPNESAAKRWRAKYPDARVEVVGSPRIDDLPRRQGNDGPTVAVSFHWECHVAPETRSAFGHFRLALPELAKQVRVIGHGHPRAMDWLARHYRRMGIPVVEDFDDVCRQADVYVCDNSSTIYEFASTGRPVVVMNAPWYRRNVHHGLRFWEAATVGVNVDEPGLLREAVEIAIMDDPAFLERREDALALVYQPRWGGTARAVEVLTEWADA